MRGKIVAALLLIGAAACGDTGTDTGGEGEGQTGVTGGQGQAGGVSGVSPTAARASSAARDCPQRCAFAIGDRAGQPAAQEAASVTEDAGLLLLGGSAPVRWTLSMGSRALRVPAGYQNAYPAAQNGWGQVVGHVFTPKAATAWEPDGSPIVLSDRPYGAPLSAEAYGINDNTVIVGRSDTHRAFRTHYKEGFRWLSESQSGARDVNFKGQVVGYSTINGAWHATLWAPDGTATDLGILPGGYISSEAVAISETGIVVGISSTAGTPQGFIWSAAEGLKALPAGFVPRDVNHWGEVAGQFYQTGECAVYYKGYGALKLPRLTTGSRECNATSINSWGDVVGYELVTTNSGRTYNGKAVLWTWGGNENRYGF